MLDNELVGSVYEVISMIRGKMSIRSLAKQAKISPTTLTSMLQRTPPKISIRTLDAIAQVFGLAWQDFFNCEAGRVPKVDESGKVPAEMSREDFQRVTSRLVGEAYTPLEAVQRAMPQGFTQRPDGEVEAYKRSIQFMLGQLNKDGVLVVLERTLEVYKNPDYKKSREDEQ